MLLGCPSEKDIAVAPSSPSSPLPPTLGDQPVAFVDIEAGIETALLVDDEDDVLEVLVEEGQPTNLW